jgi:3-deoxy-D-manno-octulosonate 8-phosphate phosphatase (KDO 8-P phosphatase)
MGIKMLVMDVDGTLTDGKIYMSANGELMKAFNIKDGYAIARLRDYGIEPVIITGRSSEIVKQRCAELKIKELHQGIENKSYKLRDVCEKLHIELRQVAYIGDDLNDLPCMKICGYSACPSDAMIQVKESVSYVCKTKGGEGAVREYIDYLLSMQVTGENNEFDFHEVKFEIDKNIND